MKFYLLGLTKQSAIQKILGSWSSENTSGQPKMYPDSGQFMIFSDSSKYVQTVQGESVQFNMCQDRPKYCCDFMLSWYVATDIFPLFIQQILGF